MAESGKPGRRRRWIVVWAIGLAVAAGLAVTLPHLCQRTLLERAEQAMQEGDQIAARRLMYEHLKQHPDDHAVRCRLAALYKPTDAETALRLFTQIPVEAPEYLPAVRHVAQICLAAGRDEEAEAALKLLAKKDANDHVVQLSLAELYFRQQRYEAALRHAQRCADLLPDRAQTYLLIADIRDELDQLPEMISSLERALELDPDLYEAHAMLSYAALHKADFKRAEAEARWCLQHRHDDHYPYWVLAAVARDEGRPELAEERLQAGLKLAPDDLNCRLLEADLLLFRRESQRAYERLKPLRQQYGENVQYLGALARAAVAAGHRDEALRLQQDIQRYNEESDRDLMRH